MPRPIPHRPIDESEVEYYTRPTRWYDYALVATPFIGIGWIIVRAVIG